MKKKVTIIVPVYNVENYVRQCLKSLCSQTYENIEILVINDGSKDNSISICKEYAAAYPNIVILNKENGGLSDARNFGIEHSSGEYLFFVDGDDFIDTDAIEILVSNLEQYQADISACNVYRYNNVTKEKEPYEVEDNQITVMNRNEAVKLMLDRKRGFAFITCNKLYKKELFEGVRFPKRKLYEDVGTIYKTVLKSKEIVYLNRGMYYYVFNPDSITNSASFRKNETDRIEMAENMCDGINEKIADIEISKRLKVFLCSQYLSVVNIMIKSETYDFSIIKTTKKIIGRDIIDILRYANRKQKMQFLLFNISFSLYKLIYKVVKKA